MDNKFSLSGTQSPSSNPFCSGNLSDQACFMNLSFRGDGGPSFAAISDDAFLPRESLGILPSTTLLRDSLTRDFLSTTIQDHLNISPRESLGILNISSLDLGRESMGIFNINNQIFKRDLSSSEKNEDTALSEFQTTVLHKENLVPQILLSSAEKISPCTFSELDKGFLLPNSRKLSGVSTGSFISANPSFHSGSLEEPSKISISSIPKDIEPSMFSMMAITDPMNDAFQLSVSNNTQPLYKSSSTHYSFASDLENIRHRIQSLPVAFEKNDILGDICVDTKNDSLVSFDICRGVKDETNMDDSVFLPYNKQINEDTSFHTEEKSFDEVRYLLDSTPQPEWGEWDSSKSNIEDKAKSPAYTKEGVSKKVDKMLGMQPVKLEEKLKFKTTNKCDSTSSVDVSHNISKISRSSQCSFPENQSNNFSQNLSKISQYSEENVSRLIKNLSDMINDKDNLSRSQRNEGLQMLHCIAGLLRENGSSKASHSEDSGHSSVDDPQLEEKHDGESDEVINKEVYEALDLSCKNKSLSSNCSKENKSFSHSKSIRNPPPYSSPNRAMLSKTNNSLHSNNSKLGNNSQGNASNTSNASGKNQSASSVSSLRRHSNISQNKVTLSTQKIRRVVKAGASKMEPLRAVLPVENMAKCSRTAVTPEKRDENKLTLKSKKTSTPLQEPKLKPMAASTPASSRQAKDLKQNISSAASKPKFMRSFSYNSRASTAFETLANSRKPGESNVSKNISRMSTSKVEGTKTVRRNSITESHLKHENDAEGFGSPRLKRSFSVGKESKILSALSKVRQNILNSPYYNPRTGGDSATEKIMEGFETKQNTDLKRCSMELKTLSKVSNLKKGKENFKP